MTTRRAGGSLETTEIGPPRAGIRTTQPLECYGCHRRPELIVDGPAD